MIVSHLVRVLEIKIHLEAQEVSPAKENISLDTTPIILQFRGQLISSKPIQNYLAVPQQDSISEKLRSKDVACGIVLIYNM